MRAAILIRRSMNDRTEQPAEVMQAECLTYVRNKGFDCDPDNDVYVGIGETRGLVINNGQVELPTERPEVKRLLNRLHEYDAVCLYKFDRLPGSGNQLSIGIIPYVILAHGKDVISPHDGELRTPEDKVMFSFKAYKAEAELNDTKQRSMDAIKLMIQQGKNPGKGKPSYGYRFERLGAGKRAGRRRVIDPATAPIVERIFREIASGRSSRAVAKGLTAEGIPTPLGARQWNPKTITIIIRDPSYKGEPIKVNKHQSIGIKVRSKNGKLHTRVIKAEGQHVGEPTPAIVDAKLWAKANEALDNRYKPPLTGMQFTTWLRGLVFCGDCNARTGFEHRYGFWVCYCKKCRLQARLSLVDEHAWQFVCDVVKDPKLLRQVLLTGTEDESLDQLRSTLATIDKDLGNLDARKARIMDRIEEEPDADVRREWSARLSQINQESVASKRAAEMIRRKLDEAEIRKREADKTIADIRTLMGHGADEDLKRRVADHVGLGASISMGDGKKSLFITCCPRGIEVDMAPRCLNSMTILGTLDGRFVELPAGKGRYARKHTVPDYQALIIELHKQGLPYSEICKRVKISKSAVSRWVTRYRSSLEGSTENPV